MNLSSIVEVEMRKGEKTCLSRLTRLSKSFLYDEDEEYLQFSLREILSKSIDDYFDDELILTKSGQALSSIKALPLSKILHWSEEVTPGKAKVKLDGDTADALDMLSRLCSLEGHHLTINGDDLGYFADQPSVNGSIALGLFLIHILSLIAYRDEKAKIISRTCQRFIKRGDHITVRLYLINTNVIDFDVDLWLDSVDISTVDAFDITFSNKGLSVSSSDIGKTKSHEFEISKEIHPIKQEMDR
jgi:hypothetical protein